MSLFQYMADREEKVFQVQDSILRIKIVQATVNNTHRFKRVLYIATMIAGTRERWLYGVQQATKSSIIG